MSAALTDEQRALEHLQEQNLAGKLNEFTSSLLRFYDRRGYLTEKQIAAVIRGLEKAKQPKPQVTPLPAIPEGYYALPVDTGVEFYRFNLGKQGRWEGFPFLDRLSGENRIPIKDRAQKLMVMERIAQAPVEAQKLYGQQIGRCGRCHIRLTDDATRALGIGPDCAEQMGLKDQLAQIRAQQREQDPNAEWLAWKQLHAEREAAEEQLALMAS